MTMQLVDYFDRLMPKYDARYWTVSGCDVDAIFDKINKGIPLPQINVEVKENKIIYGTDVYIALSLLTQEQFDEHRVIYVNIEDGIITRCKDGPMTIPSHIFFNQLMLLKYQRTIPNCNDNIIDKIDNMYAKLNRYKIVVNEMYLTE